MKTYTHIKFDFFLSKTQNYLNYLFSWKMTRCYLQLDVFRTFCARDQPNFDYIVNKLNLIFYVHKCNWMSHSEFVQNSWISSFHFTILNSFSKKKKIQFEWFSRDKLKWFWYFSVWFMLNTNHNDASHSNRQQRMRVVLSCYRYTLFSL